MALISKASLLMVPSTYEPGKLYNVLPSGNRAPDNKGGAGYDQTRADFDFDRGSNAAATRINSSGLIEKYRENVLLQSNAFSASPWSLSSATISGGQSGYDGSNDAWIFTTSVSGAALARSFSETGIVTFSVYAKAGSVNGIRLRIDTNSDANGFFDLVNGTSTSSGDIDTNIENIGSGWYRCSVSHNAVGPVKLQFFTTDGTSSYDNGSILIQSAQLETGLVATDYLNSTSTTGKSGLLIDMPRINYDANGENGALLLEPSRANIITNSEYLGGSDWIKSGNGASSVPVITSNAAISPEGVQNATRVDLDLNGGTSSGDWSWVYQNFTSTGNDETFSMYIKAVDASNVGKVIAFGAVSFTAQSLTADWVRIESTSSAAVGGYGNGFRLRGTEGTSDTASFYVFGIQHEQNASYATSYIPTYGTNVTRNADIFKVNNTGTNNLITNDAFTLFIDIASVQDSENSFRDLVAIFGSKNFRLETRTSGQVRSQQIGMVTSGDNFNSVTIGTYNIRKFAFTFTTTQCKMYVDGALHSTYNGVYTHDFNVLSVRNSSSLGAELKIEYRKVMLFPTALTEQEAITLTTI